MFRRIMVAILRFRQRCVVSEKTKKRLETLYHYIIFSTIVLMDGTVVMKCTGNPSGSANTVVDNTLGLLIRFAYVFYQCAVKYAPELREPQLDAADHMKLCYKLWCENVRTGLYGDDNTTVCTNSVLQWYNPRTIAPLMAECGLVVTFENDDMEPKRVDDLVFLNLRTVWIPSFALWVPYPAQIQKIRASLLYGSRCADPRWTLYRLHALKIEAFFHMPMRKELDKFEAWLLTRRRNSLLPGSVYKGIEYGDIIASDKTDEQIFSLYVAEVESCLASSELARQL
jgi:hypothetical protein